MIKIMDKDNRLEIYTFQEVFPSVQDHKSSKLSRCL